MLHNGALLPPLTFGSINSAAIWLGSAAIMTRVENLKAAEHALRDAATEHTQLTREEMLLLQEIRLAFDRFILRAVRMNKRARDEAAEQKSAQLAKRKIEDTQKARAMLKRVEEIMAVSERDQELRRMRDSLVGELWGLRHVKREVKGRPIRLLQ